MSYKRFSSKDLVYNVLTTYPKAVFSIASAQIFYQFEKRTQGDFSNDHKHIPQGYLSLHEMNVNRPSDSLVYPYMFRASDGNTLPTITSAEDLEEIPIGMPITSSYPMSSSISRIYIPDTSANPASENYKFYNAIRNVISYELKKRMSLSRALSLHYFLFSINYDLFHLFQVDYFVC